VSGILTLMTTVSMAPVHEKSAKAGKEETTQTANTDHMGPVFSN
jgi:hypothetical protein